MDLKDELKGVMIDRDYYSESCKIHRKNHEQWMQQYFSKQQELHELTLEFIEDSRKRTDMELVNLRRSSCGTTPPPLKKKRPNELIVLDDTDDDNDDDDDNEGNGEDNKFKNNDVYV